MNEALHLETGSDNSGLCDDEDEEAEPCRGYDSTIAFVPGKDADYFNLNVTRSGTPDGEFQGETVYAYAGGRYEETSTETMPGSQCAGPEVEIFYCEIDDKNLSVCQLNDGQVSYRFGKCRRARREGQDAHRHAVLHGRTGRQQRQGPHGQAEVEAGRGFCRPGLMGRLIPHPATRAGRVADMRRRQLPCCQHSPSSRWA